MTKQPKKKSRNSSKLRPFFISIAIIIILLIIILIITKTSGRSQDVLENAQAWVIDEVPKPIEDTNKDDETTENLQEKETDKEAPPEKVVQNGKEKPSNSLVFIIDDVGNSIEQLEPFLELPFSVTFAIMPDRRFTEKSASMITAAGKEYILHQPMEALGGEDPGKSAIFTGMTEVEIFNTLDHNFGQLPYALGMNNHMGSAATSDMDTMLKVMQYLSKEGKFFLDSFTTSESVVISAAKNTNVEYLQRNSMFLDNENDKDLIIEAIEAGKKTAQKKGRAIMIGHVMTAELAEVMMELYPDFIEEGFSLKEISELFIEMNTLNLED